MANVSNHEEWKVCFSHLDAGLAAFARQGVRSPPMAETSSELSQVGVADNDKSTLERGSRTTWTGKPERFDDPERVNQSCFTLRNGALGALGSHSRE